VRQKESRKIAKREQKKIAEREQKNKRKMQERQSKKKTQNRGSFLFAFQCHREGRKEKKQDGEGACY